MPDLIRIRGSPWIRQSIAAPWTCGSEPAIDKCAGSLYSTP